MELYRKLYYKLFASAADAVAALEKGDPAAAWEILVAAQQAAEEAVLDAEEEE